MKTNDDTREIAMKCVDRLVLEGYVKDCIDTNSTTEFSVQDIIHEEINKALNVKEYSMNIDDQLVMADMQLHINEQHRLMMRILSILEYSNLQDLKTINSFLFENGFVSKSDEAKSGHE